MKEYYKIGEISKIYDIGKDSLMYYERLGILKPIRDENSYRLYSINDIWKLNLIKELRALNFPMSRIKEYIDNRSTESTIDIFNEEVDILDRKISEFKKKRKEVSERVNIIKRESTSEKIGVIELRDIPERKAIKLNGNIKRDEEADFLIKKLHEKFEEKFNILGNNNIGSIFSLDKVKCGEYNYYKSVFCFLKSNNIEKNDYSNMSFNEGKYLCYTYKGDYSKKEEVLDFMFKYVKENNLTIMGDIIEVYKIDIHETSNKDDFITEIQIEVKDKNTSNKI